MVRPQFFRLWGPAAVTELLILDACRCVIGGEAPDPVAASGGVFMTMAAGARAALGAPTLTFCCRAEETLIFFLA